MKQIFMHEWDCASSFEIVKETYIYFKEDRGSIIKLKQLLK